MHNKLINNVRFCLGLCASVSLIGLIVGFVLYHKDDTAFAFIVTVGSGLLLFIVVLVASVTFRCLVTRPPALHPQQRFSGNYSRTGKVLHDPPPPYHRSWAKEFENSHDTPDPWSPSSDSCIFNKSFDLIRHREGSMNTRMSLNKLTQLEIPRQGEFANTVGAVLELPADDELPAYDVAIKQLSARDLQNAYIKQLSVHTEGQVKPTMNSCFDEGVPSTSQQFCTETNLGCYPQYEVVAERDLAPVHFPGQTRLSIVACFENALKVEDEIVAINVEG